MHPAPDPCSDEAGCTDFRSINFPRLGTTARHRRSFTPVARIRATKSSRPYHGKSAAVILVTKAVIPIGTRIAVIIVSVVSRVAVPIVAVVTVSVVAVSIAVWGYDAAA